MKRKTAAILLCGLLVVQSTAPVMAEEMPQTMTPQEMMQGEEPTVQKEELAIPEMEVSQEPAAPASAEEEISLADAPVTETEMAWQEETAVQEQEPAAETQLETAGTEIQSEIVSTEIQPETVDTEIQTEAPDMGSQSETAETEYDLEAADAEEELILTAEAQPLEPFEELDAEPLAVSEVESVDINETNFPDEAFRNYVLGYLDTDGDGILSSEENEQVTEMDVAYMDITDLKGIEYFHFLTNLDCSSNQLTHLNMSGNPALISLDCGWSDMPMESLDISGNPALTELRCAGNSLTSLDISGNPALIELYCVRNNLTNLDISGNPALINLDCSENKLSSLNINSNLALTELDCSDNQLTDLDVSGNTALEYLNCSENHLTSLKFNTTLEGLNCNSNNLTDLDVSCCTKLNQLGCGSNQLKNVDVSSNTALTILECSNLSLENLDVSHNTALKSLECGSNQLTSLDVSENTALTELHVEKNQLTSLDVSHNTVLHRLNCNNNQLTDLDLSNNERLAFLICYNNHLVSLNLQNRQRGELGGVSCYGNTRDVVLEHTKDGWELNLEKLVGAGNVEYVKITSQPAGMSQNGNILSFTEGIPATLMYSYTVGPLPTYSSDGSTGGNLHMDVTLNLSGSHDYQETTVKQPTCAEEGQKATVCTICGEKVEGSEKTLPKTTDHDYKAVTEPATCVKEGRSYQQCTVCGAITGEQTIAKLAHTYGAYKTTTEPTVLKAGVQTSTCSVCGAKQTKSIAKLKASVKFTVKKIPLQVKKTFAAKSYVTGLQKGDSIKTWTSSNSKVASVDKKTGKVTAKKKGTTVITVTTAGGAKAKFTVTVQTPAVKTTAISGLKKSASVKIGKTITLKPTITPATSQDKVTYASSNKKVATVSAKGVVKGVKAGTAKITVTSGKKKFVVTVKVTKPAVTTIKNVPTSKTIKKGKTYTLKPKFSPAGSSGTLKYTSSNKKVATVNAKGKITAKKKGTVTITVQTGKIKVSCKVTVK